MKTKATHETEAASAGAARRNGRGFALEAPGHRMPAIAQRQVRAGIDAAFGPAAKSDQARCEGRTSEVPVQRGSPGVPTAAPPRGNRTGLPDLLKLGVERLSGFAMDDVRVHYNSPRPAQLQALAYTQGADIHVGPGQERHLPHEAWHVAQQKQGRVNATLQMKGVAINDDSALEREADRIGALAARPGALALSPGCGCATCANSSGVPGGGAHRILPVSAPSQIGQRLIIQRVECPVCTWRVKAGVTRCPKCSTTIPAKPASAAAAKSGVGAAAKVAKAVASKAVADKGKSAEAKAAATHTVRIQLQLEHPEKVEMSEIVEHYDGTPITQQEAIGALNALLEKAGRKKGVTRAIFAAASQDVGPKVVNKIKQGAIAQSESTYFNSGSNNAKERRNRIDVENVRGKRNFTPATAAAAVEAEAPAAAAAAPAAAPAADAAAPPAAAAGADA